MRTKRIETPEVFEATIKKRGIGVKVGEKISPKCGDTLKFQGNRNHKLYVGKWDNIEISWATIPVKTLSTSIRTIPRTIP